LHKLESLGSHKAAQSLDSGKVCVLTGYLVGVPDLSVCEGVIVPIAWTSV